MLYILKEIRQKLRFSQKMLFTSKIMHHCDTFHRIYFRIHNFITCIYIKYSTWMQRNETVSETVYLYLFKSNINLPGRLAHTQNQQNQEANRLT